MTELYYESGKISMLRTVVSNQLAVKLIDGQKAGTAALNSIDADAMKHAVKEAKAAAVIATPDPAEGIAEKQENKAFAFGTDAVDRDALYTSLTTFLADVQDAYPKISFDSFSVSHVAGEHVYRNSNGVELSEKDGAYRYGGMFMARDEHRASSFNYFGGFVENLDAPLLGLAMNRQILAHSERELEAEPLSGKFIGDLLIAPPCLEDILGALLAMFISDGVLINKTSPWRNKLGELVASPLLTLALKPLDERLVARSFLTDDGYVAQNEPLITKGVLENFCLSRYGAARTGGRRSGTTSGNLVVEPGATPYKELIGNVERGILLGRFSGGSLSANGDFAGVAKNSFLIENGKIVRPLSETMISGNLADFFRDLKGVGDEQINDGSTLLPWVLGTGVVISGR